MTFSINKYRTSWSCDEIIINEIDNNKLCSDGLENIENNQKLLCVNHSSYMAICNNVYNNIKNDDQT